MAKCPVEGAGEQSGDGCPVDHNPHSTWTTVFGKGGPSNREVSSIPRTADEKWVYPSEAQFFAAMARKNHNPHASDMKAIIPIHNAVNERAWSEIVKWEAGKGGESCGGVKLVNFRGQIDPLSRYSAPFDRHDWIVDRCGTRIRYVIDFYTGRGAGASSNNVVLLFRTYVQRWTTGRGSR
ncbi:cytochrome c/c1 heme lyase-domain-containing protein [Pisolithus sp. B1]|nr:cytochrome c/c1 heme lyase-domain-containing protein [Pisolithus sp. B1]